MPLLPLLAVSAVPGLTVAPVEDVASSVAGARVVLGVVVFCAIVVAGTVVVGTVDAGTVVVGTVDVGTVDGT